MNDRLSTGSVRMTPALQVQLARRLYDAVSIVKMRADRRLGVATSTYTWDSAGDTTRDEYLEIVAALAIGGGFEVPATTTAPAAELLVHWTEPTGGYGMKVPHEVVLGASEVLYAVPDEARVTCSVCRGAIAVRA